LEAKQSEKRRNRLRRRREREGGVKEPQGEGIILTCNGDQFELKKLKESEQLAGQ
jgi:hypothetical protein